MDSTVQTLQVFGLTSSLVLAGANLGASHLTLPLLYSQPTPVSTAFFKQFYTHGALSLVPLSIFSAASSSLVAYLVPAQRILWSVSAAVTLAQLPWTVFGMMSTNKSLILLADSSVGQEKVNKDEVVSLLKRWKWMNVVRGLLAFTGGLAAVLALQGQ
ncbi:hypothetical protein F66182_10369 [Fusarium sp. NRRL 66182]|nr:hypothetical protein F66182_10369 [Fusarium sp. NRRL 66182]